MVELPCLLLAKAIERLIRFRTEPGPHGPGFLSLDFYGVETEGPSFCQGISVRTEERDRTILRNHRLQSGGEQTYILSFADHLEIPEPGLRND